MNISEEVEEANCSNMYALFKWIDCSFHSKLSPVQSFSISYQLLEIDDISDQITASLIKKFLTQVYGQLSASGQQLVTPRWASGNSGLRKLWVQ